MIAGALHRPRRVDTQNRECVRDRVFRGRNERKPCISHVGVDVIGEHRTLPIKGVEPIREGPRVGRDLVWFQVVRRLVDDRRERRNRLEEILFGFRLEQVGLERLEFDVLVDEVGVGIQSGLL